MVPCSLNGVMRMTDLRTIRIGIAVLLMAAGAGWWIINMPAAVIATLVLCVGAVILRWNTLD